MKLLREIAARASDAELVWHREDAAGRAVTAVARVDSVEVMHGHGGSIVVFELEPAAAVRLALWLLLRWWLATCWCGLRWAMLRSHARREARLAGLTERQRAEG